MNKKIISAVIGFSFLVPFMASAASSADCLAQGRTLGADNECHPTMADCLAKPGGPVLVNYQCVIIGGGSVPGGYWQAAEWKNAPVHHDNALGVDLVDISGTSWWRNYIAQLKAQWPQGNFQ